VKKRSIFRMEYLVDNDDFMNQNKKILKCLSIDYFIRAFSNVCRN